MGSPFSLVIFPSVTDATKSVLLGHALTSSTSGVVRTFTIEARDRFSNIQEYDLITGVGVFRAVISGPVEVELAVQDFRNATYAVSYALTVSGSYQVSVTMASTGEPVGSTPVSLSVLPLEANLAYSSLSGEGMGSATAGEPRLFLLNVRDVYNNPTNLNPAQVDVSTNVSTQTRNATAMAAGLHSAMYEFTIVGRYVVSVYFSNTTIHYFGSPFMVLVSAGRASAANSSVLVARVQWRITEQAEYMVQTRDVYGNDLQAGGESVAMQATGVQIFDSEISDHDNGTYTCIFSSLVRGNFTVTTTLDAEIVGTHGEFQFTVIQGPMYHATSSRISEDDLGLVAGGYTSFSISPRDIFNTPTDYRDEDLSYNATPGEGNLTVVDSLSSIVVFFGHTLAGTYQISVKLGENHVVRSPFSVTVSASTPLPLSAEVVGDGLSRATAGERATFDIIVRDEFGNLFKGDPFGPLLDFSGLVSDGNSISIASRTLSFSSSFVFNCDYVATVAGNYSLAVSFEGTTFFTSILAVWATVADALKSSMNISTTSLVAGEDTMLTVTAKDRYGNLLTSGGADFAALLVFPNSSAKVQSMVDLGNGSYSAAATLTQLGNHSFGAVLGSVHTENSPAAVQVAVGSHASALASAAAGPGTAGGLYQKNSTLSVYLRDAYGNDLRARAVASDVNVSLNGVRFDGVQRAESAVAVLEFQLPNAVAGAGELTVRVAGDHVPGSPFATLVISALAGFLLVPSSVADGVGLSAATAGEPAAFIVRAVDSSGLFATSGGEAFVAKLSHAQAGALFAFAPADSGDGSYAFAYTVTRAGAYSLAVTAGQFHISGSPFALDVTAGPPAAARSLLSGSGLTLASAGVQSTFAILARDRFANSARYAGGVAPFAIAFSGTASAAARVRDLAGVGYVAEYTLTVTGAYAVAVTLSASGAALQGSPVALTVVPGPGAPGPTEVFGAGASAATAGARAECRVLLSDAFGNAKQLSPQLTGVLAANASAAPAADVSFTQLTGGVVLARYAPTRSGAFQLLLRYGGALVTAAPLAVAVAPARPGGTHSTAAGLGVVEATAGAPATFTVTARDRFGNEMNAGGFTFVVLLSGPGAHVRGACTDRGTGAYDCSYLATRALRASLAVTTGGVSIRGAPFQLWVRSADVSPARCVVVPGAFATAGRVSPVVIHARDRFANQMDEGWSLFEATLTDALERSSAQAISDYRNGSYSVDVAVTRGGAFSLAINFGGEVVAASPYAVTVVANAPTAAASTVRWPSLRPCAGASARACGTVARPLQAHVLLRDAWGNENLVDSGYVVVGNLSYAQSGDAVTATNPVRTATALPYRKSTRELYMDLAATRAGRYSLAVTLGGAAFGGCPYRVTLAAALFADRGVFGASGDGLTVMTAGVETSFVVESRDRFGNVAVADIGDSPFAVYARDALLEAVASTVAVTKVGDSWQARLTLTTAGALSLWVSGQGQFAQGAPWTIDVLPGAAVPSKCTAHGPGLGGGKAGAAQRVWVVPRDSYSNALREFDPARASAAALGESWGVGAPALDAGLEGEPLAVLLTYTPAVPAGGTATLYVRVDGQNVKSSPFSVRVSADVTGAVQAANSYTRSLAASHATAGAPARLLVHAENALGQQFSSGGAAFAAELVHHDVFIRVTSTDLGDGTYALQYTATRTGAYTLAVTAASVHIAGSPFALAVAAGAVHAPASRMQGAGLSAATAGADATFTVEARDRFGNVVEYRGASVPVFAAALTPAGALVPSVVAGVKDMQDSTFIVSFRATSAGVYALGVAVVGASGGVPSSRTQNLTVAPAHAVAAETSVDVLLLATAGALAALPLAARDRFGNAAAAPAKDGPVPPPPPLLSY